MRPVRERKAQTVRDTARSVIESTGYDEISLSSLSSGDYRKLTSLWGIGDEFSAQRVPVSLPSLRVDSFEKDLAAGLQQVRKTGLGTFAPEAGTQRLRDVINKISHRK